MSVVQVGAERVDRAGTLLEAQASVLEMIVRGRPLPEVLAALCHIAEAQAHRPVRAAILLADLDVTCLSTGAGPSLPEAYNRAIDGIAIAPDVGTCCAAAARNEVVVTRDIASDPGWQKLCQLPLGLGLRAAWSMPIVSSQGGVLGTFGTYFFEATEPAPEERRLVAVLVRTAALAIERRRADDALVARARRDRFLAELGVVTQPLSEPVEVMAATARRLAEHLEADGCLYAEVEDERTFVVTGEHARDLPLLVGRWPLADFGPTCERLLRAGEPFVVSDAVADLGIGTAHRPVYEAAQMWALVAVPLQKDGKLCAAMAVHQRTPRTWSADEVSLVRLVVGRCWEALERIRIARELRESEARHRAIVETSPECVKILAPDGTLLQMNPAGLEMIEADSVAVLGRSVFELIAPEHRAAFRAFHERICRGEPGATSYDIIGLSGTRRSMETAAVPLPSPVGGFVHLAVTRDVTARVSTERALGASRARLDYAARVAGIGFWYCDLPFAELVWDARVRAQFFVPLDARVTLDVFYGRIHPDDREATRLAIETALAHGTPFDVVYRTIDPASGATKWIHALGGTAYDPDGQPLRFDGVTLDVTEEKLSDQRKDEFIATLAHELRNPLAPIRTGLHLLARSSDPARDARTRAAMERQLGHLVRMVDDLLDISRITLGKLTLKRERIDLQAVLRLALETSGPLLETAGHELVLEIGDEPLPLDADPTRLTQVLANLLNNAAKYTPRGGRIVLTAERDGDEVVIRVSDNGVGIPVEMMGRVFDLFMQLGAGGAGSLAPALDRAQGGLGIGLTLVRRLVAMHGGVVMAESAGPGRGSTFTVRLPLAPEVLAAAGGALRPLAAGKGPPALRVLVVDDNVDAAESLAMLIDDEGHETRVVHTGPDGLTAANAFAPDVVFLDIGLPGLSGYEVACRLRATTDLCQPVLVALTGWGSADDRRRAQEAGFDHHFVKPVEPTRVTELLSDLAAARLEKA